MALNHIWTSAYQSGAYLDHCIQVQTSVTTLATSGEDPEYVTMYLIGSK